jgi:hypothetical protein
VKLSPRFQLSRPFLLHEEEGIKSSRRVFHLGTFCGVSSRL